MRSVLVLAMLAACDFPTPSQDYACRVNADCESGRICERGYCVVGSTANNPDASNTVPNPDAAIDGTPMPDADPFAQIRMQCLAAGYAQDASGLHRLPPNQDDWLAGAADCANDVPGATHLIVLSSAAEVSFAAGPNALGWIGLSDRTTEGMFQNITGEAGDLRPWESGQPDNGGGSEDCAQIKSSGRLDDDQCDNNHYYICECDGRPPMP